ncbi:hypothetical protein B0E37_03637 [Streptomyces sp. MH192]|nr:hypothetical protein [Streptomyces sp. MH192]
MSVRATAPATSVPPTVAPGSVATAVTPASVAAAVIPVSAAATAVGVASAGVSRRAVTGRVSGSVSSVSAPTVLPAATSRSCSATRSAVVRSAGSLRSSPSMTGARGPARCGAGGSSSTTARSVPRVFSRRKGERPWTAVCSSTPSDHRSVAGPGVRPSACSGARYSGEPTTSPVRVSAVSPWTMAMPKSVRITRSSWLRRTLAGFTSRCSTPASCAERSAASTSAPMRAASRGVNAPSEAMSSPSERPRTNSITIHGRPASVTTSCTVITLRPVMRAAAHASRSSRVYMRSTLAAGSPAGARTSLTATSRRSISSRARHTVPMPPAPSGDSRR